MSHHIPKQFIFTDLDAANAEVARLYRAIVASEAAITDLLQIVPIDGRAEEISERLCSEIDAITAERSVE